MFIDTLFPNLQVSNNKRLFSSLQCHFVFSMQVSQNDYSIMESVLTMENLRNVT